MTFLARGAAGLVLLSGAAFAQVPQPQAPAADRKTVWQGAYTTEQSDRGRDLYAMHCSRCHGASLRGGTARTLVGETFARDWTEENVDYLFGRIKAQMPRGAPGSLPDQTYLDIVAYILQGNSYPPGSAELTIESAKSIRVESKDGPGVIPNFAVVRVVGCLAQDTDKSWKVLNAGLPARTRNPEPSRDAEKQQAEQTAPGTEAFTLMYIFPSPDALKGHRIEAKGILMRGASDARINVMSVQSLASTCGT